MVALVERIAADAVAVDREARFLAGSIDALRVDGLLALGIPSELGGPGGGPVEFVRAVERVASACSSTAMVYMMHVVAVQTLLAGSSGGGVKAATVADVAAGRHLTTLAFSERGSRSHFWAQISRAQTNGDAVVFDADKSWVTAAGHVDSFVTAVGAPGSDSPIATELYLVSADASGIVVEGSFDGLGMRGNASAPVTFRGVRVASERRLGAPDSGFGPMMTATLPWFVPGGAACAIGIAGAAVDAAARHMSASRLEHASLTLADLPTVRAHLASASVAHLQARALLYQVAGQVAAASPDAQLGVFALKIAAAEAAIDITQLAMRIGGGAAYSKHLAIERQFRDAHALGVMAPTTDVLLDLTGKALTGQELFQRFALRGSSLRESRTCRGLCSWYGQRIVEVRRTLSRRLRPSA